MTLDPQIATQLLLAFASAVMGAALAGAVRWSSMRRDRRLRMTVDLYSEFHSPAFNHIRIVAHEALERGGPVPAAYEAAQGEAREAISSIVHFWEKVALLTRAHALESKLLRRFFGQYARWWSPLLCEPANARNDAEWGATLTDIQWLFEKLKRTKREGARR